MTEARIPAPSADTAPAAQHQNKILKRSLALETPLLLSFSPDAHPAAPYAANPTRPARVNKMFGD